MKASELINYLEKFDGDCFVGFLITNIEKEEAYPCKSYQMVREDDHTELDGPVIVLEVKDSRPLGEIAKEVESEEEV